jgi:adenine-specific DNA-methyltransferase
MARSRSSKPASKSAKSYKHPESESPMRPEVGTQAQFKKKLPPKKYRYDDSLSPVLEWDGQNPAKAETELAEARKKLNGKPEMKEAAGHVAAAQKAIGELRAMSKPFLNWAGKAERLSFDVPTLPLFIHERLSTKAILDTLKGHRYDRTQTTMFDLFGDPQHSIADQVLRAYEHKDKWVNRMILGDSMVVMNSLLRYESLGGQVQMIYIDPPYGVRFGSNFQPFVRKRDVGHNDDDDMTREPEMVQAYRDTWELGLHSYLTYLRDRALLARELLSPTGSIFVQISDENVHSVRAILSEVFGSDNFIITILLKKKGGQKGETLDPINDYILWFAKDKQRARPKIKKMYLPIRREELSETFRYVELSDGRELTIIELSKEAGVDYRQAIDQMEKDFPGAKLFASENLTSGGFRRTQSVKFTFRGVEYDPGIAKGNCWKHSAITDDGSPSGLERLAGANRLFVGDKQLRFKRYAADFGFTEVTNWWDEFGGAPNPIYAVQTNTEVLKRCILMTTEPGDLVLDPTCGSGTTAYCAEQWGRRWITIDTSRVPMALARQRLLTATFEWYELNGETRGPAGGFSYKPKENRKGQQTGGIVPHITSSTIANDESAQQDVIVDRPESDNRITRVTGPFCVEATIPTPMDWDESASKPAAESPENEAEGAFVDRMIEILRKSPVLRLEGNRTVTLRNIRPPAKSLSLSAEAFVDATAPGQKPSLEEAVQEAAERNGKALPLSAKSVALVFGPENGAVNQGLVYQAAIEAAAKKYTHLYVTGFAIEPNARELIEKCDQVVGVPATYVQATPDLMMGDLLKNMRSSQVFSVCGMPEAEVRRVKTQSKGEPPKYEVELLGMDVFDPTTMEVLNRRGDEVPAWFLDTDYNGLCFHVSQAFFPKTGAWENLKKALRGDYEETVWDHLAGTVSAPFEAGEHGQVAVKVIDERGNELLIVRGLSDVK